MEQQRIYQGEDAQWYFNVRGNQSMGPYSTYHNAETALKAHVSACNRRFRVPELMPKFLGELTSKRQRNQARHT